MLTGVLATQTGSEFAPQLGEGDFAVQQMRSPSTGLEESLRMQENTEKLLLKEFPEIKDDLCSNRSAEGWQQMLCHPTFQMAWYR